MMTLPTELPLPLRKRDHAVPQPHGLSVVVVVPQEAFAETLAASMREGGHVVRVVTDPAAATTDVRVPQADVVVLNVDPAGGGFAVAESIRDRAAWRKPLMVALTARGDQASYTRARELGVHLYLELPVDLDRLRGVLVRFHHLLANVEGFDPVI